jgi:hypothetical protein
MKCVVSFARKKKPVPNVCLPLLRFPQRTAVGSSRSPSLSRDLPVRPTEPSDPRTTFTPSPPNHHRPLARPPREATPLSRRRRRSQATRCSRCRCRCGKRYSAATAIDGVVEFDANEREPFARRTAQVRHPDAAAAGFRPDRLDFVLFHGCERAGRSAFSRRRE